jgi:hypothetical protein
LCPILRRVRQRALVVFNPSQIAGIKPSATLVAFEEILAFIKAADLRLARP